MARIVCFALLALCAFVHFEAASALRAKARPSYMGETESYKNRRNENLKTIGKLANKGTYTERINTRFGGSTRPDIKARNAGRAAVREKLRLLREEAQAAVSQRQKLITQAAQVVIGANQKAVEDVIAAKTEHNPVVKLHAGASLTADALEGEQAAHDLADAAADANAAIAVSAIQEADEKLTAGLEQVQDVLGIADAGVEAENQIAASAGSLDEVAAVANDVAQIAEVAKDKVDEVLTTAVEEAAAVEQQADDAIAAESEAVVEIAAVADSNVEALKEVAQETNGLETDVEIVGAVQQETASAVQADVEQSASIQAAMDSNINDQIQIEASVAESVAL